MAITLKDAANALRTLREFDAGNLKGQAVWVLTPDSTVPAAFQQTQRLRSAAYMAGEGRNVPSYALRYVVTSYGTPVAWVTLDGQTHYTCERHSVTTSKHVNMVRDAWPVSFTLDES